MDAESLQKMGGRIAQMSDCYKPWPQDLVDQLESLTTRDFLITVRTAYKKMPQTAPGVKLLWPLTTADRAAGTLNYPLFTLLLATCPGHYAYCIDEAAEHLREPGHCGLRTVTDRELFAQVLGFCPYNRNYIHAAAWGRMAKYDDVPCVIPDAHTLQSLAFHLGCTYPGAFHLETPKIENESQEWQEALF